MNRIDLEQLSDLELRSLERKYRQESILIGQKAELCRDARLRRSIAVMQREADRAIERARTGVCTKGVLVDTPREVKRFHVAIRRSTNGLKFKLTDGSSSRLRREVDKAGDTSWHEFDYETQEAVILVPDKQVPLKDWKEKKSDVQI